MRLIAGIDADNRCYIGRWMRDSQWLVDQELIYVLKNVDKAFCMTAEDIVGAYLKDDPGSLAFLYAANDVEKFFQAEVANKKLLHDYMQNTDEP